MLETVPVPMLLVMQRRLGDDDGVLGLLPQDLSGMLIDEAGEA